MRELEYILIILVIAAAVQPVARRLDVPVPIAQVVCGLLLSVLPFFPRIEFDPEVTFALFVPPLLFWASATGSFRDTRRSARPILLLAVALVLVTTAIVAMVAHTIVPELPWASAFVLGAIVAPPDADVTTSIARRLGVPSRVVTVLEGETLLNDTTAFVTYRIAVRAAVVGFFSLSHAAIQFVAIGAGGVALGLVAGWLVERFARRMSDSVVLTVVGLITPFAVYLLAERFHTSGVLAVVTTGIYFSRFIPRVSTARTRIRTRAMWEIVTFCIGGLVFTLIGVQLGRVAPHFWQGGDFSMLRTAALVSATVIVVRLVWVFPAAYLPRRFSRKIRARDPMPPWRVIAVLGWAGLRGGDTLVTALAVPYRTSSGAPFPGRETVVTIAFGVIFATLLLQGLTLRPLIKLLAIVPDESVGEEERRARLDVAAAAKARLDELITAGQVPPGLASYIRTGIRLQMEMDLDDITHAVTHDGRTNEDMLRDAQQQVRDAGRRTLVQLRDDGVIGDEALRRVQFDLDFEDVRSGENI